MKRATKSVRVLALGAAAATLCLIPIPPASGDDGAIPSSIPSAGATTLRPYIGTAAQSRPVGSARVPQNPFMELNPSQLHKDTWMSDTQPQSGPLGNEPRVWSTALTEVRTQPAPFFVCGMGGFDRFGRYETACSNPYQATLVLLDPVTLAVLASQPLPVAGAGGSASGLSTAYLYLDNQDRAVIATAGGTLTIVPQTGDLTSPGFGTPTVYDLSAPMGDVSTVFSPVPDFHGRIWVTGRESGIVGVLDTTTGAVKTTRLGTTEGIYNSFAVTGDTAYVATDRRLYRVHAGADGIPTVEWSAAYLTDGKQKPGQISDGSGTTPTILSGGKYVAIVDNAATQEHVVVYRTAKTLKAGQHRVFCQVPVFPRGQGAVEDSLVGFRNSLVAVNNYGYTINFADLTSTKSVPGVERIDITASGCRKVWTNSEVTSPNAGLVLSTGNGLIYAYTRKYDSTGLDVWYWTAMDFRTGRVVWERQVGTGSLFDAYWPLPMIGRDGTLYMSAYGGVLATADAPH